MEDIHFMQGFQSIQHLDRHPPYLILVDKLLPLLVVLDVSAEVPAVGEFGYQEQASSWLIVDGFFVADDVRIRDACEDADFIESIADLSGVAVGYLDLLHRID